MHFAEFNPALLSPLTGTIQPSVLPREQELEAYNRKRVVKILNTHLRIIGTGLLISSNALLTAALLAEHAYYMKLQRIFGINLYTFKGSYPKGLYIKMATVGSYTQASTWKKAVLANRIVDMKPKNYFAVSNKF